MRRTAAVVLLALAGCADRNPNLDAVAPPPPVWTPACTTYGEGRPDSCPPCLILHDGAGDPIACAQPQ